MNTLRAGDLRSQVVIQRRAPGGGLGHPSTTWEDVFAAPIRADIRFGTGAEAIRAGQVASQAKASIRIRWRSGITADMRAVCDGVIYSIQVVVPDMRYRKHVDLVCEVTG